MARVLTQTSSPRLLASSQKTCNCPYSETFPERLSRCLGSFLCSLEVVAFQALPSSETTAITVQSTSKLIRPCLMVGQKSCSIKQPLQVMKVTHSTSKWLHIMRLARLSLMVCSLSWPMFLHNPTLPL